MFNSSLRATLRSVTASMPLLGITFILGFFVEYSVEVLGFLFVIFNGILVRMFVVDFVLIQCDCVKIVNMFQSFKFLFSFCITISGIPVLLIPRCFRYTGLCICSWLCFFKLTQQHYWLYLCIVNLWRPQYLQFRILTMTMTMTMIFYVFLYVYGVSGTFCLDLSRFFLAKFTTDDYL